MALFDLPIDKLRAYQGRNPRPTDFDAFWQRGLDELKGVAPEVERVPAGVRSPAAVCEDLYFTGTGGARVHAKLLTPKSASGPGPALCAFHGYTGQADDWFNLHAWVACGCTVLALDCRGQGGLSEDTVPVKGGTLYGHIVKGLDDEPDRLYYRNVFLDTVRCIEILASLDTVDPDRITTFGGSQGGGLSLAAAALAPQVSKCISIHPFLSDYRRVWELDLGKDAYIGLTDYFRRFDPLHEREEEVFTKLGYIDVQHLAPRIEARVLMGSSLMDTICPPSTHFAAYNKIRSPKQVLVYPDYGHTQLKGFLDRALDFLVD